jgi:hypothetical protein
MGAIGGGRLVPIGGSIFANVDANVSGNYLVFGRVRIAAFMVRLLRFRGSLQLCHAELHICGSGVSISGAPQQKCFFS